MTTAEIQVLVDDCRSQDHIQHWHALHLLDAIETLLARDNIKTFAEQEARIAELDRRCEKLVAMLEPEKHRPSWEHEEYARAVAAEVDARDEVITELLAMLKPGDEPVPPADPSTLADWNLWSAHHSPWLTKANCYRFACEIAGRTE